MHGTNLRKKSKDLNKNSIGKDDPGIIEAPHRLLEEF